MGGNSKYQPTLKELLAYKRGELSDEKAQKVKKALEDNSMLSAALAGIELTDIGAAEDISKNVSEKINKNLSKPVNSSVSTFSIVVVSILIVMSVVASVIIGVQMINGYTIVSPEYAETPQLFYQDYYNKNDSNNASPDKGFNKQTTDTSELLTKEIEKDQDKSSSINVLEDQHKLVSIDKNKTGEEINRLKDKVEGKRQTENESKENNVIDQNYSASKIDAQQERTAPYLQDSVQENERKEVLTNTADTLSQNLDGTSFVKEIELMTKTTLADKGSTKNNGSGSPFLQSSSYKSKDKNKTKVVKLPEFDGGDSALKAYIKTEIGKVDVKNIASYRTDFYLRFVIDNDGSIMTWKILGNIAPEVKAAVKKLMEEMPEWSESTEKGKKGEIEYTYSIQLNENL